MTICYEVQPNPDGLAQAFLLGANFLLGSSVALVLGDNLFHGEEISKVLKDASSGILELGGSHLFATRVPDPSRFGVAYTDGKGNIEMIVEKPINPESDYAVTGLYMYDSEAPTRAANLAPSERGELEITDLNMTYVNDGKARITIFEDEIVWLDSGTPDSLLSASKYVKDFQTNKGSMVACLEEIAWKNGTLSEQELKDSINRYPAGNLYGDYVKSLLR